MVMAIGSSGPGVIGGVEETVVTLPVTPAGDVWPSPVRYSTTTSPRAAGLFGPFTVLFELSAAAGPVPEPLNVKVPGEVVTIFSVTPFEVWPRYLTKTLALTSGAISYGTTALTCVALT